MQMYGSKASKLDRVAKGTGLGVLAGLTLLAVTQTACQPGSLQCDDRPNCEDWKGNAGGAGGGDGEGGSGGSTPITRMDAGGGGSGGGMGTGGGGGTAGVACDEYKTIAEVEEKLLVPTCGTSSCHAALAPVMKTPGMIASNLINGSPNFSCKTDKFVDKGGDPAKSYLLAKVKSASPMCPSGGSAGAQMPPAPMPLLDRAKLDCLTWYVTQITK